MTRLRIIPATALAAALSLCLTPALSAAREAAPPAVQLDQVGELAGGGVAYVLPSLPAAGPRVVLARADLPLQQLPRAVLAQAAPAQQVASSSPSLLDRLGEFLLDPNALAILAGAAVFLARLIWRDKAQDRLSLVDWAILTAYHSVNDIKLRFPGRALDKTAAALNAFHQALLSQGVTPTPAEVQRAQANWTAMHGQELLQTSAIAGKASAAVASVPPTPLAAS